MARRLRADGARVAAVASVTMAILVLVFFGAASAKSNGDAFFPAIAGLLQRISIIAGLGWLAALALWLVGRPRGSPPNGG